MIVLSLGASHWCFTKFECPHSAKWHFRKCSYAPTDIEVRWNGRRSLLTLLFILCLGRLRTFILQKNIREICFFSEKRLLLPYFSSGWREWHILKDVFHAFIFYLLNLATSTREDNSNKGVCVVWLYTYADQAGMFLSVCGCAIYPTGVGWLALLIFSGDNARA